MVGTRYRNPSPATLREKKNHLGKTRLVNALSFHLSRPYIGTFHAAATYCPSCCAKTASPTSHVYLAQVSNTVYFLPALYSAILDRLLGRG
jgi:hypothetical protein